MRPLPTGTLTLLFSDIEGSTNLLHRLGPRWGDALSTHRRILRGVFDAHEGTEMGTEGDSFFVVFPTARAAVQAAVAGQRELQAADWPEGVALRVRMGLHTGEPERHEDGYIGADVHRAARIGSAAHGGQIVLSTATRALLGDSADGVEVRDLGLHRLKDLPGEERLFDVVGSGLLRDFPPLRTLGTSAALPTTATPLIGRSGELDRVRSAFAESETRLVTLTGPGGTGKTRLAIAAAAEQPADAVYFVPLAAADSAARMEATIADALDVEADGGADALTAYLGDRAVLLVLDNLEQIPDADVVVSRLLDGAAGLRILATSRRPLLLVDEHEIPVPPLELPTDDSSASPAVEFFVRRARMVRPTFELTDDNRADVAELCRKLDGLPLALELAAANSRLLSPRALLTRIDSRLGTGMTAADRPARQRTLGATVAWSYDLLSEVDQLVFRRLGVFRRSCDLEAIEQVAGDAEVESLEVVSRLVGASLVRVEQGPDGEPRIGLLATIRGFARELLDASPEADAVRARHLRWCTDVVVRINELLRGPMHTVGIDLMESTDDDVRAALGWSLRAEADEAVLRGGLALLAGISRSWYRFGFTVEAREWQERALTLADAAEVPEDATRVDLLHGVGITWLQHGEPARARALFERSLALAERLDRVDLQARACNDLGLAARYESDFATAMPLLEKSVRLARAAEAPGYESNALANIVVVLCDVGRMAEAAEAALQSIDVDERLGQHWAVAVDRLNYVAIVLRCGDVDLSLARYDEWAEEIMAFRDNELNLDLCETGAGLAARLGRAEQAARLVASADRQRAALPMPRSTAEQALLDALCEPARNALTAAQWDAAYASGWDLPAEECVALTRELGQLVGSRRVSSGVSTAPPSDAGSTK